MMARESSSEFDSLDIAVAHWHVRSWGGAEYLVTKLAEAIGQESVYTLGAPSPSAPNPYGDVTFVDVRQSLALPRFRRLVHRTGRAAEYSLWADVDWREFGDPDVLITSGATSRAVLTPDNALHVNYCHSPPRWLYDRYHDRKESMVGLLARPVIRRMRSRDQVIDPRVDRYLANSPIVARRIWKYYKREAAVLYPPIERKLYRNQPDEGYYLHLGRLDKEKGVPAIVAAFEELDEDLVVVGTRGDVGRSVMDRLDSAPNIEYLGFVDDERKRDLLSRCSALVFNAVAEDFGIVPIEANASGKPVIARNEGYQSLYLEDGATGLLHDGSANALRSAIEREQNTEWNSTEIRQATAEYSTEAFEERLHRLLAEAQEELSSIGSYEGSAD